MTTKLRYPKPFILGDRWLSLLAELKGTGWQRPLTQEQRGQLKMLADVLGARTSEVMTWAVRNWPKFSARACLAGGSSAAPAEPHIGFLLKYCQSAVDLIHEAVEYDERNKRDAILQEEREQERRAWAEQERIRQERLQELTQELRPDGTRKYNDRGELMLSREEMEAILALSDAEQEEYWARSTDHPCPRSSEIVFF